MLVAHALVAKQPHARPSLSHSRHTLASRHTQVSHPSPVAIAVALLACAGGAFAQPAPVPTGGSSLTGTPAIALGVALSSSGGGNSCAKASSATWTLPNAATSYYAFYGPLFS